MIHIKTETGSEYVLDLEHKLWERTLVTPNSGSVRTSSGSFYACKYALGEPLILDCPPLIAHTIGRMIATSLIVELEER